MRRLLAADTPHVVQMGSEVVEECQQSCYRGSRCFRWTKRRSLACREKTEVAMKITRVLPTYHPDHDR